MALVLSPAKIVLLATELAAKADVETFSVLAARHSQILRKELLLRIVLTYLPETVRSSEYVDFIQQLDKGDLPERISVDIDTSTVEDLSEEEAVKKVRKLRLLSLAWPEAPVEIADDLTALFLLRRAYLVDEEAGLLDELPGLLVPFLDHARCIRDLMVSAILPLLRRNCEYYPQEPIPYTLSAFQNLPDRVAVDLLLSQTGVREEDVPLVGRDLKGLVGPWLYNEKRWTRRAGVVAPVSGDSDRKTDVPTSSVCPGWEQVLEWLTTRASKSWKVAVGAIEQWDGPGDVDLGGYAGMWLSDEEQEHLEQTYARAALASAYLIPDPTAEALEGAYSIVTKIASLLDHDPSPPLSTAATILPPVATPDISSVMSAKNATFLRNRHLEEGNPLTSPTKTATGLLQALVLSAFVLTKCGSPCSVRRAGELVLIQDEREQMAEAAKVINAVSSNGPKSDDKYWIRIRNEILWLRDWGSEEEDDSLQEQKRLKGVFGQLKREFLEVEMLKAMLVNTRYSLARSLYEDSSDQPISRKRLQDAVFAVAMNAYDNASNPNRTRGGVKKCDDIIHAFPKTIERSLAATQRIEALLKATHSLSEYRLVLQQGEPFTPVVLRVHADPISIIGKVLEQNPKTYTRITDLLDLGANMVEAGLTVRDRAGHSALTPEQEPVQRAIAERRITAMCIDAALTEDDFETAYSYVVNRLSAFTAPPSVSKAARLAVPEDNYSWKAALQAGKYRRTARTLRPTHLGTASGNPEIRHLEQRIDCLATALRVAPPPTLQEILNVFRRAEEELHAAIEAEDAREDAWDAAGDFVAPGPTAPHQHHRRMPGAFGTSSSPSPSPAGARGARRAAAAASSSSVTGHQAEEAAPMSLFDLSRASVMSAQRNLTALSSLQRSALGKMTGASGARPEAGAVPATAHGGGGGEGGGGDGEPKRVRKRDQLREAAMGTLVSGVSWLINAPSPGQGQGEQ